MTYSPPSYNWGHFVVLDLETIVPGADPEEGFPAWPRHEIVCTSLLLADRERYNEWRFELVTVDGDSEDAIRRIDQLIAKRTVVTVNGRAFDAPVLGMAAMRRQVFDCDNIARFWSSPRFGAAHADLVELFGNYGAVRGGCSMKELSRALDVSAKVNCDGGDVATMMAAGEIEKVRRYCEQDTASTLHLWAHWAAMRQGDPAYHATLLHQFDEYVWAAGHNHLADFTHLPRGDELRRRSAQAIAKAGAEAVELREHLNWVDPQRCARVVEPAFEDYDG